MNPLFRLSGPQQAEWLDEAGALRSGSLAEFAAWAGQRRVTLVAPGEALLLTRARVPGRSRALRLKALPYALEDALIEPVEELHFAVAGEAVAVLRHELLQGWLASCREAGLALAAVVPDVLCLPYGEDAWSALADGGRVVLRSGPHAGFACEREAFPTLLGLALSEAADPAEDGGGGGFKSEAATPGVPALLRCWGELPRQDAIATRAEAALPALAVFAQNFAAAAAQPPAIDLLQGPYSVQGRYAPWLKPWRLAAALAGVWLTLQGAGQVLDYWRLEREHARLSAAVERVFREAVPDARRLVNPRAQLANRLAELRREGAGGNVFFDLLQRGGRTLSEFEAISLQGLRYQDARLDLELEGGSPALLDRLRQRLAEQTELRSEMRTSKRDDKMESRIRLSKNAS